MPERRAAQLSFAGAATFLVLLTALHLIKPDLDPSWHFISEYAIGRHGWVMVLAFLSLAVSYTALSVTLRSQLDGVLGRIGLGLLLVSALGLTLGALFTTDPITSTAKTPEGRIHNIGGTLGMAMPFAAAFVSWSLARRPEWAFARRSLVIAAVLAVLGFMTAIASLGIVLSNSGGTFGPDVRVGWPTRLETVMYCVWLMVVARAALRQHLTGTHVTP